MATYDIDDVDVSALKTDDIINCDYSGVVKTLTLPIGQYKFECWGAQGGSYSSYYGGAGGYSVGTLQITEYTVIYLYAGGQPQTSTSSSITIEGGFNGGGKARYHSYSGTTTYCQAGGGATDIRIGQDSLHARVIVAGGGGGSASVDALTTKYGGGISGGSPQSGYGATQTAAGTNGFFGLGGNGYISGYNYKYASGGGGGGWYGGGAVNSHSDSTNYRGYNGGGSGYVYTESTASNYPSGCLLNSTYYLTDASTTGGNQLITEPDGTTATGHSGDGYIRITVLKVSGGINGRVNIGGTWNNINNMYVKVNNIWNSVTGAYIKKDGEWLSIGGGSGPSPGPTPTPTPTTYTVRIAPTSYTYINTQPSVTNPANMYTNTDSDTYADALITSTSTILKLTGFDISTIPSNATVTSFVVKTKAKSTSVYCYYNPSYAGKQSANINLSSTATTYSFDNGNITWEDLKTNFNSSHTALDVCFKSSSGFSNFSIYGAEIEVTYEL